jgi:hypothetical protein
MAAPDADRAMREVAADLLHALDGQGLVSPLARMWRPSLAGRCEDWSDDDSRDGETRLRSLVNDPSLRVLERRLGSAPVRRGGIPCSREITGRPCGASADGFSAARFSWRLCALSTFGGITS